MASGDLVTAGVRRLREGLQGMRFGSIGLRLVVRDGRIVRAELEKAESFEAGDQAPARSGGEVLQP